MGLEVTLLFWFDWFQPELVGMVLFHGPSPAGINCEPWLD